MAMIASNTTGMGFGAYGSLQQGSQTAALLDSQAKTQRNNATQAVLAARSNAERLQLITGKHMGGLTTAYSANGVDLSSGSVMAVMAASASNAELDRQNILHGGDIRAANFENQARMDEMNARHAIQAGYFNAMSSLFGGGSKMMGNSMGGGGGGAAAGGDQYATDYAAGDSLGSGATVEMGAEGAGAEESMAALA